MSENIIDISENINLATNTAELKEVDLQNDEDTQKWITVMPYSRSK